MGKKAAPRRLNDNEAKATLGTLRISPQKLNLIAEMIRGRDVLEALDVLQFSRKRAAKDVHKLLTSAIANAEENHGLDLGALVVAEAYVGKSLVMKRFMARARGRGARILKPFSRMEIIVREQQEVSV